jgi:hypothetical protein
MPTALRHPRATIAAAVLVALAVTLVVVSFRPGPAGAQVDAGDVILDASVVIDPDANGYASLAGGSSDVGIDSVVCSGSNPQGGTPQIPAEVMCQLLSDRVQIRVKNHVGASVTGLVRVVVFYDIRPEQGALARARAALEHPRQIG